MSYVTTQRFITGLAVYDTYCGMIGTIVAINFDNMAVCPVAPAYTGSYFVVQLADASLQGYTTAGKRIDSFSGEPLAGVTLLTDREKNVLFNAGYPGT